MRELFPCSSEHTCRILQEGESSASRVTSPKVPLTAIIKSREVILRDVQIDASIQKALLLLREVIEKRCREHELHDDKKWQALTSGSHLSVRTLEAFLKALKVRAFIRFFKEPLLRRTDQRHPGIEFEDVAILIRDILRHRIVPKYQKHSRPTTRTYAEEILDAIVEDLKRTF